MQTVCIRICSQSVQVYLGCFATCKVASENCYSTQGIGPWEKRKINKEKRKSRHTKCGNDKGLLGTHTHVHPESFEAALFEDKAVQYKSDHIFTLDTARREREKKKARLAKIPRGQIIMFSHQTSWDNLLPGEQRSERKRERGKKIETQKHLYVTHTHTHTHEHSSTHAHTSFSSLFLQTGRLQDTKCHCCC